MGCDSIQFDRTLCSQGEHTVRTNFFFRAVSRASHRLKNQRFAGTICFHHQGRYVEKPLSRSSDSLSM